MKAKEWVKARDFAELIQKYDPFGFKEPDGTIRVFHDFKELYEYTLEALHTRYKRGYIDLVDFVCNEMGIPVELGERIVKDMTEFGINEDVKLIDLLSDDMERNIFLRQLMKGLHSISGTEFDELQFSLALSNFTSKHRYERQ